MIIIFFKKKQLSPFSLPEGHPRSPATSRQRANCFPTPARRETLIFSGEV